MDEEIEFYRETEFKDTKIGKLPEEWEVRTLGEIGELSRGLSYRGQEKFAEEVSGGYLFLTLNSIKEGGGLKENGWSWIRTDRLRERHFVREGDIVIANTDLGMQRGHILGAPALLYFPSWYRKDRAVYSMDLSKLQLKSNLHHKFLFCYLSYVQPIARKYQTGTNVWHLNLEAWSNELSISLPPLAEQRKISEILSTVDESIQKTDDIIAKTERLKKGLMQELLTKGIGHKEFKDTEIGKIPKEWEVVKLENVVEIEDKYRIPVKKQDRQLGPFPYCGANGIIEYVAGYTHDGKFVLLAEDGGFFGPFENSAYIMRGKFWANNHVHILKAIEEVLISEFLAFCLNFINLVPFLTGSTRPKLTQEDMGMIPLPLPPLEEQQKIAEIISAVDEKLEILKQEKVKLERIKRWFMEELLSGRIRVRVA